MKITLLLATLVATLGLTACDRPTVVNTPPSSTVAVPVPVPVPGPAGPQGESGKPGSMGATGDPGKSGSTTVIAVPVPMESASAPK